ncbi:hypothetical protein [Streptomyces sp. NPDC056468]|uniref:hypothetical protein n=1 Tax=Streptomyces sp. NPDC056468 TaxID=3345830 RepID=UPI0036B20333
MSINVVDALIGQLSGGQLDGERDAFQAKAQAYDSCLIHGALQRNPEGCRSCAEQIRPVGRGKQG